MKVRVIASMPNEDQGGIEDLIGKVFQLYKNRFGKHIIYQGINYYLNEGEYEILEDGVCYSTWQDNNGEEIKIKDMDTLHIYNCMIGIATTASVLTCGKEGMFSQDFMKQMAKGYMCAFLDELESRGKP